MMVWTTPTAADAALAVLRKRYRLEPTPPAQRPAIPTGIAELDQILGGGIPVGAVTEVSGPAGVGKSTLAMVITAQAQRAGLGVALVAGETPLTQDRLHHLGVDTENLIIFQPDSLEMALEAVRTLAGGEFGLVVMDSVAAFPPRYELQGEIGDYTDGKIEQVWDQAYRCIGYALRRNGTALLLVNQMREKRGVMFGDPRRRVAEEIIAYWASVRLNLRRVMALRERGEVIGHRLQAQVLKNKAAPPHQVTEFDLFYGSGMTSPNLIEGRDPPNA